MDDFIELSRNDLARFFSCVPSQINYVLNTRFTINNGYVVESQRGGSGYIKVSRLHDSDSDFLKNALQLTNKPISLLESGQILDQMLSRGLISERERGLIKATISTKALNNPINIDNNIRGNILTQIIIELMKEGRK